MRAAGGLGEFGEHAGCAGCLGQESDKRARPRHRQGLGFSSTRQGQRPMREGEWARAGAGEGRGVRQRSRLSPVPAPAGGVEPSSPRSPTLLQFCSILQQRPPSHARCCSSQVSRTGRRERRKTRSTRSQAGSVGVWQSGVGASRSCGWERVGVKVQGRHRHPRHGYRRSSIPPAPPRPPAQ